MRGYISGGDLIIKRFHSKILKSAVFKWGATAGC